MSNSEIYASCANNSYNFKKEAQVFIVYGGNQYRIDISEINFTQTYTETSYSVKTLQAPKLFEGSIINKANPANWNLTFPALKQADLRILFDRALDYQPFDIYVRTQQDTFEIKYCVITQGSFVIQRTKPLGLSLTGEGTRLSKFSGDIPGSPVARSGSMTYNRISDLHVELAGENISDALVSVSLDLNNNIQWIPWTHVNGAIHSQKTGEAMYPSKYVMNDRSLSGRISQYLSKEEDAVQQWNNNTTILLRIGQGLPPSFYGFQLDIENCTFRNEVQPGSVFVHNYDWRLTQNPSNLSDIVEYITY